MLSPILTVGESNRYKPLFIALSDLGIKTDQVASGKECFMAISTRSYAAVVIEWDLPSSNRLSTLKQIRKISPNLPVVALLPMVAVSSGLESGWKKSTQNESQMDLLVMTGDEKDDLSRLLETLKRLVPELQARVLAASDLFWIQTPNKKMKELLALVDIIKDEPSSVLIQGENGTGKEVIARLLHFSGRRHSGQFVAINCAAIPETLLESELFGHEKGSFTGATDRRIGKFELSHKGTIFLDEIGDMPLHTQGKILRVLETEEVERVGGHEKIPVEIRIVAATNKKLLQHIDKGYFRQDLYYRINTFALYLPPLRERQEDVLPLAQYFIDMHARKRGKSKKRLSRATEQILLNHNWPGNVRELRNAMERAMVLAAGNVIGPELLPEEINQMQKSGEPPSEHAQPPPVSTNSQTQTVPLKDMERKVIVETLSQPGNNVTNAAKQLGISRATLFRKLKQYGISRRVTMQS